MKPMAARQANWQATAIGQMYLSLHLSNTASMCSWQGHFVPVGPFVQTLSLAL